MLTVNEILFYAVSTVLRWIDENENQQIVNEIEKGKITRIAYEVEVDPEIEGFVVEVTLNLVGYMKSKGFDGSYIKNDLMYAISVTALQIRDDNDLPEILSLDSIYNGVLYRIDLDNEEFSKIPYKSAEILVKLI